MFSTVDMIDGLKRGVSGTSRGIGSDPTRDPMGGCGVVETGYLVFSLKSGPKGSITGAHLCLGVSLGSTSKSLCGGSTFI